MQTIGERLEEARKKKGISIREAAEATKMRGDYLQKFENNQFDIGLAEIYTRGFLRNYAAYLKLPADRILGDYAALGRGDVRPRQPSREIYGRMDISVATAGESNDRAAPPEDGADGADASTGAPRIQPRYPRSGGASLPAGPDPAVVFKYVKWGGIGVTALLVILIIKALLGGKTAPTVQREPVSNAAQNVVAPTPATTAPAPNVFTYRIVALDVVQVRVTTRIARDSSVDGEEIFSGLLQKGQSRTITLSGPQNLYASAGQNIYLDWKGRRIDVGFRNAGSVPLDIPANAGN